MGIKGLYSSLKIYSIEVSYENEPPSSIAIDAYPFLYKYKENIDACIDIISKIKSAGHTLKIYIDGVPPKEKMEELAQRKQIKEVAYQQAKALRAFLNDNEKSAELDAAARLILEKQIELYEKECWTIRKDIREEFITRCRDDLGISIIYCKGEADDELIRASLSGEADIVIANDMDLFVGGVERLWMLEKGNQVPLFMEFRRTMITQAIGIHPKAWVDVALLAGYEKAMNLKCCSASQAIIWIRHYGCIENIYNRRKQLLKNNILEKYQEARKYFIV